MITVQHDSALSCVAISVSVYVGNSTVVVSGVGMTCASCVGTISVAGTSRDGCDAHHAMIVVILRIVIIAIFCIRIVGHVIKISYWKSLSLFV